VDTLRVPRAHAVKPAGRETNRRAGALNLTQTWDATRRLRAQALTMPAPGDHTRLVQRRAYTYRGEGAVTNVVDQIGGVRTDELDQLGRAPAVTAADVPERRRSAPRAGGTRQRLALAPVIRPHPLRLYFRRSK
jgi:hypothetical protein